MPLVVDMPLHGEHAAGAAKRRRDRRLRAWHRHVRTTVAMELATALHHSAQRVEVPREGVEGVQLYAPRRPKPPLPGKRPGLPPEPEPQVRAATVGYVAAAGPLLVPPVLGGGDTLDDATVSFLLAQSLLERQELEEMVAAAKRREEKRLVRDKAKAVREVLLQKERKMARIDRLVDAGRPVPADDLAEWQAWHAPDHTAPSLSSSSGKRRKRKKRRKRRTPRTSSLPGRARRRQRQRHVPVSPFGMWSMSLLCGTCSFHRCNDEICADYYIYFRFKLIGKGRSEQWEVFLYCDKSIKVDRDSAEVSPRAVPPFALGGVGFGLSPNLDTMLTIYELCLPSVRGCVELSCGGGFFTPGGAYDSVWVMVKPLTGNISSIISSTMRSLGVFAC